MHPFPVHMATLAVLPLALLTLMLSALAVDAQANQTLSAAIQEMQKANYFTFVMLLNMIPSGKFPDNITFFMPNNRILAKAVLPENDVLDFLLRHSIPTSLRFDHLKHFPTGSIIPSSDPHFALKVSNGGRKDFFLNNVKLVSPDICVAGSSIRCHGIDGVLQDVNSTTPLPNAPPPMMIAPPPMMMAPPPMMMAPPPMMMAPPLALPPPGPSSPDSEPSRPADLAPGATPQPAGSGIGPLGSGSLHLTPRTYSTLFSSWVGLSIVWWFCN